MKKIIFLPLLLFVLCTACKAQVVVGGNGFYLDFIPYKFSRIHVSDSVQLSFTALTNQTVKSITVKQTSGPVLVIHDSTSFNTGISATDIFWLYKAPVGNYGFLATVTLGNGQGYTTSDSLIVLADPICPVCPVCPTIPASAARVLTWSVVSVNGINRIQVTYWDNTTAILP